nr:MAG TPA: Oxaloacetate decarboxylase, gamma chain [Caudoviricetes sp.]
MISVLNSIIKYLILALCCFGVTFLFLVYVIGMILIFVWIIKE